MLWFRNFRQPSFALAAAALAMSCSSTTAPFVENFDIAVCHQTAGPFSSNVTNPYFPLVPGTQSVLQGTEDGVAIRLEINVLNPTEVVAGVTTRVLEERHSEGGVLIEVSRNFFVQASDGSVCYFGEDVDDYQNGVIVGHGGQWRAGLAGAVAGVFMPGTPAAGQSFRQEVAPGVAEDRVVIAAVGESVTVPFGTYTNTVRFLETTPLEPDASSTKVYASGVGTILDDVVRLTARSP